MRFVLFMFLILASCRTPKGYYPVNGKSPNLDCSDNCQNVIERIKDKLLRSPEDGCYFLDDKSIQVLEENDTCFKGWKVSDVVGLFGEPSIFEALYLTYRISEECDGTLHSTSHIVYFIYEDADLDLADRVISYHSVSRNYPSH